jgi:flagellar hook-length control protein FliK
MPTPVKSGFPSPAQAAVRGGAATGGPADASGTESFQDELVRRRRVETPDKADKPAASRKAESKKASKPRPAARPARGKHAARAEETDVSMEAEASAARAPAPADAADVDVTEVDDTHGADEPARTEQRATDDAPDGDTVVTSNGIVAVPATGDVSNGTPAEETEGDASPTAPGADDVLRARSIVHAADGAEERPQAGNAPAESGTRANQAPALFEDAADSPADEAPASAEKQAARPNPASTPADPAAQSAPVPPEFQPVPATDHPPHGDTGSTADVTADALATAALNAGAEKGHAAAPAAPAAPPLPPEVRFASANHETIVTSMRAEVLPNGGSMRIRLDPPQLGALQVTVQVRDGLVTAAFETTSDEATRLLGHSLNQLKSVLESHGVAVDKLQVQQAPRDANASSTSDDARRDQSGQSPDQEHNARQEQQRREMLQRMWRRLAGGQDPLDLTA